MSRTINESIQTLETSRDNIVEALNAKLGGVNTQLKISEVADKINSIETGGGGLNFLENVTWNGQPVNSSLYSCQIQLDDPIRISGTFKFTPKEDVRMFYCSYATTGVEISPQVNLRINGTELTKGTEYTLTFSNAEEPKIAFKSAKDFESAFTSADLFIFDVF